MSGAAPEALSVDVGATVLRGDRWRGEGPPVVFLHAGVADRRSFLEVAAALGGHEMLAYDRRGAGETEAGDDEGFTHVADLLAVLEASVDGPAVLVGSSMGGGVALDAARLAPERVASLVLVAPAVSGTAEPVIDGDLVHLDAALEAAYARGDLAEISRLEAWLWLDGPSAPEGRVTGTARALFLEMNAVILANARDESEGASGLDTWDRLEEIGLPALVACGDLDVRFLLEQSKTLAHRLPAGRYVELAGTAHLPYLEAAAPVADLVLEAVQLL